MTEQLHDLLTRIADQAGPGNTDPTTLWSRAQHARRRDRAMRASAVALTALALVGAIAIGLGTRNAPPPAKQTPPTHQGIPSTVRGLHGNGGLDLETDLAVGPASVAIENQSGAFVITAADGVYHRLRLPGSLTAGAPRSRPDPRPDGGSERASSTCAPAPCRRSQNPRATSSTPR
jgi:hypothetical protein